MPVVRCYMGRIVLFSAGKNSEQGVSEGSHQGMDGLIHAECGQSWVAGTNVFGRDKKGRPSTLQKSFSYLSFAQLSENANNPNSKLQ